MGDLLNTAVSGLLAYQQALATTSHNITNVNTPGYSRQTANMVTNPPQFEGSGFIGTGVQVDNVTRAYSQYLTEQVRSATSLQNQYQTTHDMATQIDNLFADATTGVGPAMQNFFNSVQDLSSDPTSTPARQVVLSQANSLAARFNDAFNTIDSLRQGVNTQMGTIVQQVNSLSSDIASVNKAILNAPTGTNGQQPNDLLDRRDALLAQLAQYTSVRTLKQSNGTVDVYVGKGQVLVSGTTAQKLTTVQNAFDPTRDQIAYVDANGNTTDITSQLSGGKLGGLVDFRTNVLDPAANGLGKVAIGLAQTFNDQHQLGQDLNGNMGGDFFNIGSPDVMSNSANTGTASISAAVTDVSKLTTSNYTLKRNGSNYTLTRLSDNKTFDASSLASTGTFTADGVTLTLNSGAMADGDQFLIRPTYSGSKSIGVKITNTNEIAAAAPIVSSAANTNTGDATISAGTVNGPPPVNTNLTQPVTITFTSPTQFSVSGTGTGNPTGVAYTSGGNITYNGWTVQISGTPAAGDTFTVGPNTNGVGDNRNALLLAGLQDKKTLDSGATSLTSAYGTTVAAVGSSTKQADLGSQAQSALLSQATASRNALSGVNLDEEASNLVRFQQAYQASARVINTANQLFQSLLSAVG